MEKTKQISPLSRKEGPDGNDCKTVLTTPRLTGSTPSLFLSEEELQSEDEWARESLEARPEAPDLHHPPATIYTFINHLQPSRPATI